MVLMGKVHTKKTILIVENSYTVINVILLKFYIIWFLGIIQKVLFYWTLLSFTQIDMIVR